MKKITLVVLDREKDTALEALRKTGVLHVERREAAGQGIAELQARIAKIDQACAVLSDAKAGRKLAAQEPLDRSAAEALVERVLEMRDRRRDALDIVAHSVRELERLAPWGEVDPAGFSYLAGKGIFLHPFEMSPAEHAALPRDLRTIVLGRDRRTVRVLVWSDSDRREEGLPASARELPLPEKATAVLRADRESATALLAELGAELSSCAVHSDSLAALKRQVLKELEFETILNGMPVVSIPAGSDAGGATGLCWLTGFVPVPEEPLVLEAARANGWACISDDPADGDLVPTQIRNNRIVNLISPLLDFLGTVPGYREMDISLWFLIFFGIFFAMIFGDAGYGLLIVCIALYGAFSSLKKKKEVPTALFMMLYLGSMTVVWGTITCTWFGIAPASLPGLLRAAAVPAFSGENPESATNIKIFCFTLGLIQISLAHVIGIINNRRSLKLLGEAGALFLAVGMYFVVLNLVVDADRYPLTPVILGMVAGGFLLNFLFVNYAGRVGAGILESLKNVISMILGVVNMFGDIMSYIRLWAVGLAGSAISATINEMAGPLLGGFIVFAGVILLFFGHGLNSVMNVLSVLVHGVRLNTLEFSNHLGLTWSGFKYEPFSETVHK